LPAGLSINASTGLISGHPDDCGQRAAPRQTAKDTTGASGSATFSWNREPARAAANGTFPITFQNNTRGHLVQRSDLRAGPGPGRSPAQWSYLKSDGTLAHISHPGREAPPVTSTKNGVNYPNMSFHAGPGPRRSPCRPRLEGAPHIHLGRLTDVHRGSRRTTRGWAGPGSKQPSRPEHRRLLRLVRVHVSVRRDGPSAANTTQVDMFGFSMTARPPGKPRSAMTRTVGITLTRAQVMFRSTRAAAGSAFQSLAGTYRIVRTALVSPLPARRSPGELPTVLHQSDLGPTTRRTSSRSPGLNQTFTGRVSGNTLTFTKRWHRAVRPEQARPRPTSWACSGATRLGPA